MKKFPAQTLLLIFFSLLLVVSPAFGAINLPEQTEAFYVADHANVLSDSTREHIARQSAALADSTGAEIVVVTVDFLDGASIIEYSDALFNTWELGDAQKNNGMLILLAIGEDDYRVTTGTGLNKYINSGKVSTILNDYLEPYFAQSNYDGGVRAVYDQFFRMVENAYGPASTQSAAPASPQSAAPGYSSSGNTVKNNSWGIGNLFVFLLVIAIINIVLGVLISALTRSYNPYDAPPPMYGGPVYRRRWYSPFWRWGGYYPNYRYYYHNIRNKYYNPYNNHRTPPPSGRSPYGGTSNSSGEFWGRSSSSGGGSTHGSGASRTDSSPFGDTSNSSSGGFWGRSSSSGGGSTRGSGASRSGSSSPFGGSSSGSSSSDSSNSDSSSYGGSSFGSGHSSGGGSFGGGSSFGGGRSSGGGGSKGGGGGRGGKH